MRKRLLNRITYITAVFCMLAALFYCPTAVYAAAGSVTFGSESYEEDNNTQFQIGVYLKTDSDMGSYHVELQYDNSRMEYTGGADSEENGVITLEGVGVSNEIKYMLSFKSKSGGDAYINVKNAVIYTSQTGSTEQFEVTNLPEAPIKISGEDTGAPRQDEQPQQPQYVGPFETTVPHLEPAIKMNNTDYYVVDSNQYVPDSVKWKYTLVPGKLGDMDVTFLSNKSKTIYFLTLVDSKGETHLYSYSNSEKQLFECNFYNNGKYIYYCTSPYACDNWPEELSLDVIKAQNVCYVLKNNGVTRFYTVNSDGSLSRWNPQEGESYEKNKNIKYFAAFIILLLIPIVIIVIAYLVTKRIKINRRRKDDDFAREQLDAYAPALIDIEDDTVEEITELNRENPVISVKNVTMRFKIADSASSGIKEYFIQKVTKKLHYKELVALDNVSFDVYKGEVVGIIGTNGSGKSTMLRLVSGVINPTSGHIEVDRSKVQLLTLGTGFDMELTARENVYLNGSIIGYSKKFLDEHFDEIIEFAELENFVDEKVKNFSSGMVSRLGFSIATAGDAAEILILDEVLSVGDEFFRKKSLARVKEMIHGGSTVLLVSHSMGTILDNCSKVVWIEKGKLQMVGDAKVVCQKYQEQGK
nr:ABC transporter ATP-binding protein [uncultured Agathobacter sp.]